MKGKFIKNIASLGLFAVLGLAACGANNAPTGGSEGEGGGDVSETKTSVTVTPVEHASALVTFGSYSYETWSWTYSFEPTASVSDYSLTEADESLVIVLSVEEGYDITAVSVNEEEIMSYMKGDEKAIYPVEKDGDYVVTLTVEAKPEYDSTVTHVMNDYADIQYVVVDAEWNEYDQVEYYDPDDWNEPGHISFPYSEGTLVNIFVTVFDPSYEIESVVVNGEPATACEHPMTGATYYEYEIPEAGDYVVLVNLSLIAA